MSFWIEIKDQYVRPMVHDRFHAKLDVVLPDTDEYSSADLDEIEAISGLALILDYSDAKGNPSQRLVSCNRLENNAGVAYLRAFCHQRRSIRAFRVDRISSVFDPTSGESLGSATAYFNRFSPTVETRRPTGGALVSSGALTSWRCSMRWSLSRVVTKNFIPLSFQRSRILSRNFGYEWKFAVNPLAMPLPHILKNWRRTLKPFGSPSIVLRPSRFCRGF